jgi:uncharacterized protein
MKFQPDFLPGVNAVSKLEAGQLWIHQEAHQSSVLVPWRGVCEPWAPRRPEDLLEQHFEPLLALQPELVIFGSGRDFFLLPPSLYRRLIAKRIGVESMDTAAACRTFNVLAQEGRKVLGAFLLSA